MKRMLGISIIPAGGTIALVLVAAVALIGCSDNMVAPVGDTTSRTPTSGGNNTVEGGKSAIPVDPQNLSGLEGTSVPQQVFFHLADHLELPTSDLSSDLDELVAEYSWSWFDAAAEASDLADYFNGAGPQDGAPRQLAARLAQSFYSLSAGYEQVGADFAAGKPYAGDGFATLAVAFDALSVQIPQVHRSLAGSETPLREAAGLMQGIANFFNPHAGGAHLLAPLPPEFLEIAAYHLAVAEAMLPADEGQSAAKASDDDDCPESHPFRGCTAYVTTSYGYPPSCGGWSVFAGGIGIGAPVSVDVLSDCGLWRRRCTYTTTVTTKCVCVCYGSRWDRFWASDGVNKTVTETSTTSSETCWDWDWNCGVPSSSPPDKANDITMGDEDDC